MISRAIALKAVLSSSRVIHSPTQKQAPLLWGFLAAVFLQSTCAPYRSFSVLSGPRFRGLSVCAGFA